MRKRFVLVAALAAASVGVAETFPNLDGSGDISKITVDKTCLANSNALLPEKCEFYVDGNDLMLKVHKKMGLMLILR